MDNIEYTISRYELHPPNFPTCISVGFLVRDVSNGNTETLDTLIPLEEANGKTQSEVCDIAFTKLSDRNKNLLEYFQKRRDSVAGSYFIPN